MNLDTSDPKVKATIRQITIFLAGLFSLYSYYNGLDMRDTLTVLTLMGSIGGVDLTFMAINRKK